MTTDTTHRTFDMSGFNLARADAQDARRQAELARSDYLAALFHKFGKRVAATCHSARELFDFTQRQNEAARL